MADIGGAVRGGYNPNATEVWQEALRIPAVKVYERGELRKDVWDLIFANIRLPIVQEDMRAEIGSCTVGERRLQALVGKYGLERFEAHKAHLFASTRKMMEAEIRAIPNGVYRGEAKVYFDGKTPGSVYTIRVKQRHIHLERLGEHPHLPADGQPRHPAQRGDGRAHRDHHPRGHDPQRVVSCSDHLREPPVPAERRRDHPRAGAGHPGARLRRLEPAAVLALDRPRS
jgi:hypothetical protein